MRVLVTRPAADAARTARRLAALGHETLALPVIGIRPTDDPAPTEPTDALIVTSANAVPMLAAFDRNLPAFAVGARTAQALREAGFAAVQAAGGDGAALAGLVRGSLAPGARLLHAAGRDRKPEPEHSLKGAGFAVALWTCYEASPVTDWPDAFRCALATGQIGAALHYSRRSAGLVRELSAKAGLLGAIAACPHLCLSADVAAALAGLDAPLLVASEPLEEALLALIARLPDRDGVPQQGR
ncbi:MAG TPA: uroporphyrinogen-III synthase [Microvirga sp.]|jgi:uroporphyrinogen-III synthase